MLNSGLFGAICCVKVQVLVSMSDKDQAVEGEGASGGIEGDGAKRPLTEKGLAYRFERAKEDFNSARKKLTKVIKEVKETLRTGEASILRVHRNSLELRMDDLQSAHKALDQFQREHDIGESDLRKASRTVCLLTMKLSQKLLRGFRRLKRTEFLSRRSVPAATDVPIVEPLYTLMLLPHIHEPLCQGNKN